MIVFYFINKLNPVNVGGNHMKNGYFGVKEVIRNGAEQFAARKKYYQCPDDNKVFNQTNDS